MKDKYVKIGLLVLIVVLFANGIVGRPTVVKTEVKAARSIVTAPPTAIPTPTSAPTPQPTMIPVNTSLSSLAKYVHFRETGYGRAKSGHHIYCRNQGLWNEIGYNPQGRFCFASAEEGFAKLEGLLSKRVASLGVPGALCNYNLGGYHSDCSYYQEYLLWQSK